MQKLEKETEIKEITTKIIQQLDKVSSDPEMLNHPKLKADLIKDIQKLKKTNNLDKITASLCQEISWDYLANSKDFPKSVINLYYHLRQEEAKYDGVAWSSVQAGLTWFE